MDLRHEACGAAEESPYAAAIGASFGAGPDGVAGLEGEVGLEVVDWGVIIVFYFAEL